MRILLRCDGAPRIGVGHVVRSLALAQVALGRGHSVDLLGRVEGPLLTSLTGATSGLRLLGATGDGVGLGEVATGYDVVHVDHYDLGGEVLADLVAAAGARPAAAVQHGRRAVRGPGGRRPRRPDRRCRARRRPGTRSLAPAGEPVHPRARGGAERRRSAGGGPAQGARRDGRHRPGRLCTARGRGAGPGRRPPGRHGGVGARHGGPARRAGLRLGAGSAARHPAGDRPARPDGRGRRRRHRGRHLDLGGVRPGASDGARRGRRQPARRPRPRRRGGCGRRSRRCRPTWPTSGRPRDRLRPLLTDGSLRERVGGRGPPARRRARARGGSCAAWESARHGRATARRPRRGRSARRRSTTPRRSGEWRNDPADPRRVAPPRRGAARGPPVVAAGESRAARPPPARGFARRGRDRHRAVGPRGRFGVGGLDHRRARGPRPGRGRRAAAFRRGVALARHRRATPTSPWCTWTTSRRVDSSSTAATRPTSRRTPTASSAGCATVR